MPSTICTTNENSPERDCLMPKDFNARFCSMGEHKDTHILDQFQVCQWDSEVNLKERMTMTWTTQPSSHWQGLLASILHCEVQKWDGQNTITSKHMYSRTKLRISGLITVKWEVTVSICDIYTVIISPDHPTLPWVSNVGKDMWAAENSHCSAFKATLFS